MDATTVPDTDTSQSLRQTVVRLDVTERNVHESLFSPRCEVIVPLPHVPLFMPGGWEPPPCPTCGWSSISEWLRVVHPSGGMPRIEALSPYAKTTDVTANFDSAFSGLVESTDNAFVPASEGRGWRGGPIVGVVVEKATHKLIAKLRLEGNVVRVDSMSEGAGNGALVAALSAKRQEVVFIGERDGQGNVLQRLRVYDFERSLELTRPLLTEEIRLLDPVATTYLPLEDAYYVLDRAEQDGAVMRLLRITRGNSIEPVAQWARSATYTNWGLTATERGHLVISTWNATSHNVAILEFASDGLRLLKLVTGSSPLAVPAYGGADGTFVVTSVSGVPQDPRPIALGVSSDFMDLGQLSQVF